MRLFGILFKLIIDSIIFILSVFAEWGIQDELKDEKT